MHYTSRSNDPLYTLNDGILFIRGKAVIPATLQAASSENCTKHLLKKWKGNSWFVSMPNGRTSMPTLNSWSSPMLTAREWNIIHPILKYTLRYFRKTGNEYTHYAGPFQGYLLLSYCCWCTSLLRNALTTTDTITLLNNIFSVRDFPKYFVVYNVGCVHKCRVITGEMS